MNILHDERERAFAPVGMPRFAYGTGRGIRPERFVISPPVIIAGKSEPAGCPQNQERG
jgi:hypothetical protein